MIKIFTLICLLLLPSSPLLAHELDPSLLRLIEQPSGEVNVLWKTTLDASGKAPLTPIFPAYCQQITTPQTRQETKVYMLQWQLDCSEDLAGGIIAINGLADSTETVLVKIEWQDGRQLHKLLDSSTAEFKVFSEQTVLQQFLEYAHIGVEHIWFGPDHLLFVLALVLLVSNMRSLLWTITAFTVGHSVTLSLVVLGFIDYPVSLVEFTIAASILVLALELVRRNENQTDAKQGWIGSHSWIVAISFGLLHGMGFAGALREVGLPPGDIPLALFSFNVGIETGQVIFVLAVLLLMNIATKTISRTMPALTRGSWWLTVYTIGGVSVFWCLERGLGMLA
jgi:hydrogenase/urease accessory protein HupE